MLIIGTEPSAILAISVATSAFSIASAAAPGAPPFATPATPAIWGPIAPALSSTIASSAILALSPRRAVLLGDRPAAEFARGNGETKVRVVSRELPVLRPLVARTVTIFAPQLERPATDRTEGFHDAQVLLAGSLFVGPFAFN